MLMIPFPFMLAEIFIFFACVGQFGFLNTLLIYFLPCLLGFFILNVWGRAALFSLQTATARGEIPGNRMIHAGAIVLSGICFLIPSFFARLLALFLFLPGLRHFLIWKFKAQVLQKMSRGSAGFQFGGGFPFGKNPFPRPDAADFGQSREREVHSTEVLDVKPLSISHEYKTPDDLDKTKK